MATGTRALTLLVLAAYGLELPAGPMAERRHRCGRGQAWAEGGPRLSGPSSDDLLDHLALDERQPLVAAQVRVGQLVLVEAELVQDRGVDVAEVVAASRRPAGRWRRWRRRPGRP